MPKPKDGFRYIDRPEFSETFADELLSLMIDQSVCRLEFVVKRFDDPEPPKPPTGRKYTIARIVMPTAALFDAFTKVADACGGRPMHRWINQGFVILPTSPETPPELHSPESQTQDDTPQLDEPQPEASGE